MADQDVFEQLKKLTTRQREVLRMVCEGNEYKVIGQILFISEETVKTHMANIYIELGLNSITPSLRRKILYETYCPVLHEVDVTPKKDEPVEPELAPEEVIQMVEADERALVVSEPININIPSFKEEPKTKPNEEEKKYTRIKPEKKKSHLWRWVLLFIIIALITFGGMQVYTWVRGFLNDRVTPMVIQNTPKTIPTKSQVQPTRIPTQKAVVVPTNTKLPATPVPTRTPESKITLPFIDDFSNGINSPWSVGYGNWFVTDSGASISISDIYDDAGSIVIDDPTLTDYKLRVKVRTPHMWSASQGQFGVIVRYSSTRDQNIIFYMDSNGRFRWSYATSISDLPFYLPPITGVDKDLGSTDVTLEIVVSGNTFTARVNGANVDQFSMTGYENGGIVLITSCGRIGSCPSFSDLSIESIN